MESDVHVLVPLDQDTIKGIKYTGHNVDEIRQFVKEYTVKECEVYEATTQEDKYVLLLKYIFPHTSMFFEVAVGDWVTENNNGVGSWEEGKLFREYKLDG